MRAQGLGKCYRLWERPQGPPQAPGAMHAPAWGILSPKTYYHEFWALQRRRVRTCERGERRSASSAATAAGKSTLLQMLCGTLRAHDRRRRDAGHG